MLAHAAARAAWRVRERHNGAAAVTVAPADSRQRDGTGVAAALVGVESARMPTHSYAASFYAIPPLVCGAAMLALGIGTLLRERGSRVAVSCVFMATIQCIWLFAYAAVYASTVADVGLWWARVAYIGVTLSRASVWYFVVAPLALCV